MSATTQLRSRGSNQLNDRQMAFCHEYVIDYDLKRAALAAGYSAKNPTVIAAKLMKNPLISKHIGKLRAQALQIAALQREEVLLQLAYCLTRSAADFCDDDGKLITNIKQLGPRAQQSIDHIEQEVYTDGEGNQTVKTKFRLVPKAHVLDMAMKHFDLYASQKHEVKVSTGDVAIFNEVLSKLGQERIINTEVISREATDTQLMLSDDGATE